MSHSWIHALLEGCKELVTMNKWVKEPFFFLDFSSNCGHFCSKKEYLPCDVGGHSSYVDGAYVHK
jgi:hypothetical protein